MKRRDRLPTVVAGIVMLFLLTCALTATIWGATQTTYEVFGNPETDTVLVVRRNTADGALIDSTMRLAADSSFPHYVELTWDDTKDYSVWILNHFSEGWFPDVPQWKKFTGAAATIDYGRIYDTIFGGGPFSDTFVVFDSLTASPPAVIPNAHIIIYNQDQSASLARTVNGTDAVGRFVAGLDSGIYVKPMTFGASFNFPNVDSFLISGHQLDTIYGYAFIPSAPTGDSTATVYGWLIDDPSQTTTTVEGLKVTFTVANDVYDICNGTALAAPSASDYADSTGYFEVELLFSSCLATYGSTSSGNIEYQMKVQGWTNSRPVTVPDSTTYKITWQ